MGRISLYNMQRDKNGVLFDENGNILPDEILAVRFENSYDDLTEEDNNEN